MVPQTLSLADGVLRTIRIYKVQKNGDLCDKYGQNMSLLCEYDPQGITLKCFTGKLRERETERKIVVLMVFAFVYV